MSGEEGAGNNSPLEDYLDRLLDEMVPGRPRHIRRLLAETEAHLRDATAEAVARGVPVVEAEREAVQRFGPARDLARAERSRGLVPLAVTARACVAAGLFLGAIGAIAVGISGAIAGVFRLIAGPTFLIDVTPGERLAPADCARWLAGAPGVHSCARAAVLDWADEVVWYRIALGVLGVAALFAFVVLRRRWQRADSWVTLPPTVVDTIAASFFGLSGVWLTGLGVDAIAVASGHGAGQWLSAAPVALAAGGYFGLRLLRDLRETPLPMPEPATA